MWQSLAVMRVNATSGFSVSSGDRLDIDGSRQLPHLCFRKSCAGLDAREQRFTVHVTKVDPLEVEGA